LIVRLQEAVGKRTKAELKVQERGRVLPAHVPLTVPVAFAPFEIKTLRVGPDGSWREARLIEED
jgi:hypothetical protein